MCNHEWVGHSEGVTCVKCNASMTQEEFRSCMKASKAIGSARGPKSNETSPKTTEAKGTPKKAQGRAPKNK